MATTAGRRGGVKRQNSDAGDPAGAMVRDELEALPRGQTSAETQRLSPRGRWRGSRRWPAGAGLPVSKRRARPPAAR